MKIQAISTLNASSIYFLFIYRLGSTSLVSSLSILSVEFIVGNTDAVAPCAG